MLRTYSIGCAALLLMACGGETKPAKEASNNGAASDCAAADSSSVALAVADFIATAVPQPLRFLALAGSDSAVPEPGFRVLQDKGPTFFWTSDAAAQKKLREKLDLDGPWASMLVVYKGKSTPAEGKEEIRLGGHYIGGEFDNKEAPVKSFAFHCESSRWVRDYTAPAPKASAAKKAPDSTKR